MTLIIREIWAKEETPTRSRYHALRSASAEDMLQKGDLEANKLYKPRNPANFFLLFFMAKSRTIEVRSDKQLVILESSLNSLLC